MKILSVLVDGENGQLYSCHAIEYANGLWLVPEWIETPSLGYKIPARIIRFDQLEYAVPGPHGIDIHLIHIISKHVLYGKTTEDYEVLVAPDIRVSFLSGVQ